MTLEDGKVYVASILGVSTPAVGHFFDVAEPWLKLLLLAGQAGVAIVTTLYIIQKIRRKK